MHRSLSARHLLLDGQYVVIDSLIWVLAYVFPTEQKLLCWHARGMRPISPQRILDSIHLW